MGTINIFDIWCFWSCDGWDNHNLIQGYTVKSIIYDISLIEILFW